MSATDSPAFTVAAVAEFCQADQGRLLNGLRKAAYKAQGRHFSDADRKEPPNPWPQDPALRVYAFSHAEVRPSYQAVKMAYANLEENARRAAKQYAKEVAAARCSVIDTSKPGEQIAHFTLVIEMLYEPKGRAQQTSPAKN